MTFVVSARIVSVALLAACAAPPASNTPSPADPPLPSNTAVTDVITAPASPVIELTQTGCMGECPHFDLAVHGDAVTWNGVSEVAAMGARNARLPRERVEAIDALITRARFFERDHTGKLPDTSAVTYTCSDTRHTKLTIQRGNQRNAIDDAHCVADPSLDALEHAIEQIARDQKWYVR